MERLSTGGRSAGWRICCIHGDGNTQGVQRRRVNIVCLCIEKLIVRNWLMWFWIVQGGPGGPADGADGIGKQPAEGGRGAVFVSYSGLQVIGWGPHTLGRPVSLLSSRQFKCVNLTKTDSLEKTLMPGRIEGQSRRGQQQRMTVGWHHWFNGHKLGQSLGDGEGQRGLGCCRPWGHNELDTTCQLNNNLTKTTLQINTIN